MTTTPNNPPPSTDGTVRIMFDSSKLAANVRKLILSIFAAIAGVVYLEFNSAMHLRIPWSLYHSGSIWFALPCAVIGIAWSMVRLVQLRDRLGGSEPFLVVGPTGIAGIGCEDKLRWRDVVGIVANRKRKHRAIILYTSEQRSSFWKRLSDGLSSAGLKSPPGAYPLVFKAENSSVSLDELETLLQAYFQRYGRTAASPSGKLQNA